MNEWRCTLNVTVFCVSYNVTVVCFSVVDGEDLSRFDNIGAVENSNKEDTEALDKLEWELASQSGRLTGE